MQHAPKFESVSPEARRTTAAIYGMAALLAVCSAYAMLLAQPGLIDAWSATWRQLPYTATAPAWLLPALSAGIAIGSAAAGIALLAKFVRGVQAQPYVWLAPVLVGFSTLVLVGTPIVLPWSWLPSHLFALAAAPALLGGGAVLQMRGTASKAAGAVLIGLPGIALAGGYAALHSRDGALPALGASAQLFLFVLALTSCGVAFVAVITRGAAVDAAAARAQRAALSPARLQAAELRAAAAERRALHAERELARGGDAELAEFKALARPGLSVWLISALCAGALGLAAAGLYFGVYAPLVRRAAADRAVAAMAARKHAAVVTALRARYEGEQSGLRAQLEAERSRAAAALSAEGAAKEALARAEAAEAAAAAPPPAVETKRAGKVQAAAKAKVKAAPAAKAKAKARPRSARARRPARAAKAVAKPAAAAAAAADAPEFDRETRRAVRDSVSDDPLDGL